MSVYVGDVHGAGGCEDALLLREFAHRAFNELAVADAAVALARRSLGGGRGTALLDQASARLQGIGEAMRVLARPTPASVDLGAELGDLCRAMLASRPGREPCALDLDLPRTPVDGVVGRRIMLIAAELVANAHRHGLAGGGGRLSVGLRRVGRDLVLEVTDDGAGPAAGVRSEGLGLGSGIVGGLAELLGGEVALERGTSGAVARVTVPAAAMDRTGPARDGR